MRAAGIAKKSGGQQFMNGEYQIPVDHSPQFQIQYDQEGRIISLQHPGDPHGMNWATSDQGIWGTVECDQPLDLQVTRCFTPEGRLQETYCWKNNTDFDIYAMGTSLGIRLVLPDYYTEAGICMTSCCHTHLWCGGSSSYVMALRMGGEAPHLGLILTEGSLQGYSVERLAKAQGKEENVSNHRGNFLLHPEAFHLCPGEEYRISWELFWFEDREEFHKIARGKHGFLTVQAPRWVILGEEEIVFQVTMGEGSDDSRPTIIRDGQQVAFAWDGQTAVVRETPCGTGEYRYEILWDGKHTQAIFRVLPDLDTLLLRRCQFLAQKQQCRDQNSHLYGAFLIYDLEEKKQYYSHKNDHNGGRERVGMGVLLAHALRKHPDPMLMESLKLYVAYVMRELYDGDTGEVFNDMPRCRDYIRLYNYPWIAQLFLEMYQLEGKDHWLDEYKRTVECFYREGGSHYYAIGMPMKESVDVFRRAGRTEDAEYLVDLYCSQGDFMAACGRNYPAHEVDYEQSIVAPAAIYMCELYQITGEEKYLEEARRQLQVLELFQGDQPDYHLNQVAIRHWDGYWFGKRKLLGDTFPHYWSVLSGWAYTAADQISQLAKSGCRTENTLRGVLSLFGEDGSASCAMVYPMSVNGTPAHFYDPWANDQDWGLYYAVKYLKLQEK